MSRFIESRCFCGFAEMCCFVRIVNAFAEMVLFRRCDVFVEMCKAAFTWAGQMREIDYSPVFSVSFFGKE